ncbi:hypothetical protein GUJ93_ZPchr0020g33570 [Zizania palustris]|uniref:Uncharacterized protein n=1 Tax=Zizania palustris TaxID=103762 RepID=A0A8J5R428_ZIZPA|nr:hypothetical protein GUJ93_ZPchr0020g33570 [Zizania palustris]
MSRRRLSSIFSRSSSSASSTASTSAPTNLVCALPPAYAMFKERLLSGTLGPDDARHLFDEVLLDWDLAKAPNQLLSALARAPPSVASSDGPAFAIELFKRMDRCASPQAAPNSYTYSILIDCYRRAHRPDLGLAIFGRLLKTGLGLNVVAYNTVIDGFFKEGEVDKAYDLFREIKKQGISPTSAPTCFHKMPIRTVNGNLRDETGFIRELRMLVSFLGFEHEPMYHGVFPDEEESFCEVTVVVQPSPQTAHTYRGGGPTFLVASQRTALQALTELRMIYDSELYDTDFRFVPLRTPGSPHSVFVSTLSQRHSAIGHTMRLLEAMDDLHYEALQDANGQRDTISFYRHSSEDLNRENGELRRRIQQGHRLAAEAEELRRQNELLRQRVTTNPHLPTRSRS